MQDEYDGNCVSRGMVNLHEGEISVSRTLFESEGLRVTLYYFEAGQGIPIHNCGCNVMLLVLQGEGVFIMGEEEIDVRSGSLLVIPSHVVRGVVAHTSMRLLAVVSPAVHPMWEMTSHLHPITPFKSPSKGSIS